MEEEIKYLKKIKRTNKILTIIQIIIMIVIIVIIPFIEDNDCNNSNITVINYVDEISAFNAKFIVYCVKNVSSAYYAKLLANVVISNNATTEHTVYINSISDPADIVNYVSELKGNITISVESYDENGRIQNIKITNTDENNVFEEKN